MSEWESYYKTEGEEEEEEEESPDTGGKWPVWKIFAVYFFFLLGALYVV